MPRDPDTNRFLPMGPADPNVDAGKRAWLAAMADGLSWRQAEEATGISKYVAHRWREADAEFREALAMGLRSMESDIIHGLYFRATAPPNVIDPRAANVAAIVWGKRHFPEQWLEARAGAVNVNVTVQAQVLMAAARDLGLVCQVGTTTVDVPALPAPDA